MNWQDNPDLIEKGLNHWLELMERKLRGEAVSIISSLDIYYQELGYALTRGQLSGLIHSKGLFYRYIKSEFDIDFNPTVKYWQQEDFEDFLDAKQKITAKLKKEQEGSIKRNNQEAPRIASREEGLSVFNRLKKIGRDALKMIRKESLSKIIKVSPGFKSVVNLQNDFSDVDKIAAYIPTKNSVEILVDLADNLHEAANRRSRLIMGTYGTGKSHLLLFLANFLIRPIDDPAIKPFMDKLSKWPEQKGKIEEIKNDHPGKFLIVLLEGDRGDFSDALLRALDKTIIQAGLDDFLPDTAFAAALRRIDELENAHHSSYENLKKLVKEEGLISIDALSENLRNFDTRTYNRFLEIHKKVSAGAPFYQHHLMEPKEVYANVAEKLRETGEYEGIVIIWDEFGRYMERVVEDPESNQAHQLQSFAESCNGSGKNQIHFYLACHRSLDEYVALGKYRNILDVALPADLEAPLKWLSNLGKGKFVDGYAIVVLAENETQAEKAKEAVVANLCHKQIIVGIPNQKLECIPLLIKHQALKHLEESQATLYGKGAEQREIWEDTNEEYLELLKKKLKPLFEPEEGMLDWYANGEKVDGIFSTSRLRKLVSDRMTDVFPLTPPIPHERLITEKGSDTIRKFRIPVIDKILQKDGPNQLPKETGAQKHVINAVLINNGILRKEGEDYVVEKPDPDVYKGMAAVWDRIEKTVEDAKEKEVPLFELINDLKSPPFGIRSRCIPLILACVFRKHVLNGNLTLRYRSSSASPVETISFGGEVLEQEVMKSPDRYYVHFADINMPQFLLLAVMKKVFEDSVEEAGEDEGIGKLLKTVSTGVVNWFRGLPQFAQHTQKLSPLTIQLRDEVFIPLEREGSDSHELLLSRLPSLLEFDLSQPYNIFESDGSEEINAVIEDLEVKLKGVKDEMEKVVGKLKEDTKRVFHEVFDPEEKCQDAFSSLANWYDSLPSDNKHHRFTGDSGIVIKTCEQIKEDSVEGYELVVSTAKKLTGVTIEDWQDNTLDVFRGRLEGAKRNIDEFEPIGPPPSPPDDPLKPGYIRVSITENNEVFTKSFKVPEELSALCGNLDNLIQSSLEGFKRSLTEEECLTVLTRILERELKQ